MGKDAEFLLKLLSDGEEHELGEILQRSVDERGHGLTVHSRAADLRKLGYKVKNRQRPLPSGRSTSHYQLLGMKDSYEQAGGDAARLGPDGVSSSLNGSVEPTQKAEATTAPEASEGWDNQADPEQTCDGGHGQDVAPTGSAEGARAEAAMTANDGEGDPGSALNAGQEPGWLLADIKTENPDLFEAA